MATKRRPIARRRLGPDAELAAWRGAFGCGYDYFSDLEEIGFASHIGARQFDLTPEFREAALDAWQRLGAAFLLDWQPTKVRARPWAEEAFGPPPGGS